MTTTKPCPACQSTETTVELTPDGPHYGKLVCAACGRFLRWQLKPETPRSRRPASHKELAKKYGRGYCEWCLTPEDQLPPRQVLEGHHIIEYADGGSDQRDNVLVLCTACHKLAHWMRDYCRPKDPRVSTPLALTAKEEELF